MSLDQAVLALVEERLPALVAAEVERITAQQASAAERMPEVMTTRMLAEILDCTAQHVNTLARVGALKAKFDGNRRIFLREWVLDYLTSDRTAPAMSRADRERLRNRNISAPSGARTAMKETSAVN